jgi:beta-lactamase superfamily II metal-dependent hydrolase
LTHVHGDHIGGILAFLRNPQFKKIEVHRYWINARNLLRIASGSKISAGQGKSLEQLLIDLDEPSNKWDQKIVFGYKPDLPKGIDIKILSPDSSTLKAQEKKWESLSDDYLSKAKNLKISNNVPSQILRGSLAILAKDPFAPQKAIKNDLCNSVSISFILRVFDTSILLLADSRAEIIEKNLNRLGYNSSNPLNIDYVKVSHHGSINNTSCSLLDCLCSDNYIISTNGGNTKDKHPDREVIARIIYHPKRDFTKRRTIYFNYSLGRVFGKAGDVFDNNDLESGNWNYVDNITLLPQT